MIRRPPRSTLDRSAAASDVYKRQVNDGPWALFRLFERVKLQPGPSPEKFRATFEIDGRKAVFDVTASSVRNPFRLPELRSFACPNGL